MFVPGAVVLGKISLLGSVARRLPIGCNYPNRTTTGRIRTVCCLSLLHDRSIRIHLHLETPAQCQPNRFAGKTASEQVIIKPGELFCIHWRGKGPELSFESLLEWFQFGFGGVGFLQLFSNELGVQTAGAKLPLQFGLDRGLFAEGGIG